MQDIDRAIGQRLRQIRWSRSLTQQQVGDLLGVTFQQIQKFETGANRMSASQAAEICRALDVPLSALIPTDDDDRPLLSRGAVEVATVYDRLPRGRRQLLGRLARAL